MQKAYKAPFYVGIDLHKLSAQIAIVDFDGKLVQNEKVPNNKIDLKKNLSKLPGGTKCVIESSSVWYKTFLFLRDDLGLDVVLSNPYQNHVIATSRKKNDKVDARVLAEMLRGGYISTCYVPSANTVSDRQLVRYRVRMTRERTRFKNLIHGILLQESIEIPGTTFTVQYNARLRALKNWRIDEYLNTIYHLNDSITRANVKIAESVRHDKNAKLLTSIPGIGEFSALALSSEIGDVSRFSDSSKIVSNAGLVPSVRGSADIVHHGSITRLGSNTVRWVLTEAVKSHVRYSKKSPISLFYSRLAKKRGKSKATVAAAAKLLKFVYWMLVTQTDFDTLIKKRKIDLVEETKAKIKRKQANNLAMEKKRKQVKKGGVLSTKGKATSAPTGNDKK